MSPLPAAAVGRRPWRVALSVRVTALSVGIVLAGCAEPDLPEDAADEGAEQPVEAAAPDPARDALQAQLVELRGAVAVVRDELAAAVEAPDASAGRQRGERAVSLLVDAPELRGTAGSDDDASPSPALFPGTTTERGSIESGDVLTATLTAARDAGGSLGRSTLELLRDPLAGDLGTWQRDPAGVVASVRETTSPAGDLPDLERAVFELPGEGTRALAWAMLAADAPDQDTVAAYAERGIAHLDLVLDAVDTLIAVAATDVGQGDPEGDGPAAPGSDEEDA